MQKKLKQSILTSYLIGVPIGVMVVLATIWLPILITGEGLLTMLVILLYKFSITGLVIAFLIALWFGGKLAYENIKKGESLLLTSFKYSTLINLIIWITFCFILGFTESENILFLMILPIIAFVICTILTTFSIGLLISYIIKKILDKPAEFLNSNC